MHDTVDENWREVEIFKFGAASRQSFLLLYKRTRTTMKHVLFISTTLTTVSLVSAQTPNPACAPNGAHIQTGSVTCHCNADQSVTCDAFSICGVGNTNANVDLVSTYTATVQCRNHGGQIVDVKSQPITKTVPVHNLRTKNGCLTVPSESTTAPSSSDFTNQATCPNNNWTKELLGGTVADHFTFNLVSAGFDCPYISFSQDCSS
ncbi:hypothetical protein MAC_04968 [Metarhizium acridum CQMa 102]|uniref:Uncharacterized protein n=1 Tax=Metarhizium acridum (strain CQMa 102) TaxID=655827 RepID=E9E520_METAQ|nr:uncharacterized protein MAC_04968 [Metarhizium acridum CQMa 102]EFY89037.1 hypothetical protein MAC_04968 [Metarhizium acridum CQMa 102]